MKSQFRKVRVESFTEGHPYGRERASLQEDVGNLSDESILDAVRDFLAERARFGSAVRELVIKFAEDSAL